MPNPYLDLLEEQEAQRQRGQAAGIAAASTLTQGVNPDDVGRARATAAFLGVPPAAVEALPQESAQQARVKKIDQDTAAAPVLRQRYTDADFMKLASDDSGVLANIESALRNLGGAAVDVGKYAVSAPGAPGGGAMTDVAKAARAVASSIPSAGAGLYGLAAAPLELVGLEKAGGFMRDQQQRAQAEARRWMDPDPNAGFVENAVMSGFQSGGQNLLTLPLGLAGRGEQIMLGTMGAITFGQSYGKGRDAGLSPARAVPYAAQDATAEIVTEKYLGAAGLLQQIKAGASAGKLFMYEVAKEVPGEMAATLWQNFNEWTNVHPEKSVADFVKEQPAELAQTVIATLVGGTTQIGAVKGLERVMGGSFADEHAVQAADQRSQMLAQIMQLAAASKVRERDPGTFEGFLQSATEDGPIEKVFLNPKDLQDAGIDLTQLAEVAPTAAAQIQQALETGADVAIPTSELATRLPGTEMEGALLQHLKTEPGGFSQAGAQVYLQQQGEQVRQQVEKVMAEHEADTAFKASIKVVEDNVRQQLAAANRFTDDVNNPYAAMWANFFGVQAARLKITPEELFARYQPRIVAQTAAGALLDQDVPLKQSGLTLKDNPAFAKWFGDSKIVDEKGEPLVLYHGTTSQVEAFDPASRSKKTGNPNAQLGFFFSDSRAEANRYATQWGKEGGNVMAVHLAISNPYEMPYREFDDLAMATFRSMQQDPDHDPESVVQFGDMEGQRRAAARLAKHEATAREQAEARRAELIAEGYDGIVVKIGGAREFIAFHPEQIKSATGNNGEFDPNNPSILRQNEVEITRGSFNPQTNTVALLKAADLSTFLHESGHFFLEVLADMATQQNAPAEIADDFAAFLKWTGVADAAAWQAMSLEEKRAHHEDFARGFEAYLFEGKAPSLEVQGLFQRFRAWLLNVYRDISALNIALTPEIRGVFDRMLATTDQIKVSEDVRGYEALFQNKPEGMTEDEWAVYQAQSGDATQDAIQELQSRSLRDMKWLANAKSREIVRLQKEAKARRKEVEDEVRAEVEALPVYQAIAAIKEQRQSDPLDRQALKDWRAARDAEEARLGPIVRDQYLATPDGAAATGIQKGQFLARNKRAMANEVEKMVLQWEQQNPRPKVNIPEADLAAVATLHGFTSADELRKAIDDAQPVKDVVEGMTDQRMLERYGDLSDDRSIERAAEEAIHNDARLRFAATEANALQKATGKPALLAKAVRQFASDIIARTKVRDLRPGVYTAAERRAAQAAAKAMRENKLEDAAVQARNKLINGHAAKEAMSAQEEARKAVEYLRGFNRESLYKTLDGAYVDQIHRMLERFDLREQSLKAIDRRASLAEWLATQEEAGLEPDIPPELANEAVRTSYKNLTMEELRGLRDTVKQIEHLGRLKHKLLTAKDQRDYEAIRDSIVASIVEHAGDKVADNRTRPTALDGALRLFNGFVLEHRKVASLVRELDGFKDGGVLWEYVVRSMNEAGDREATMRAEGAEKLAALVKPMLEGGKRGGSGIFFPGVQKSFNREERLGIALNMGNAGNVQRLLGGEGWNLSQVKPILDTLTAADWQFVQGVWDFIETYRPLIAAKERRVYGKEPNWVDAQPLKVETADGQTITLRGGYFPIKYDPARSGRAEAHADAEAAKQMMRGAYTSATTRRSFTKARAEEVTGRPLMYSTDALFNGVNEIIHDLAWHEWLIDANRLLRSKSIDGAIRNRYGAQVMQQLKSAVKDIAAGEFPATHAFERGMGRLRAGTVVATMGLNITNTIINVSGLTQSWERIGTKWIGVGRGKFATNPLALSHEVTGKSEMMANRARTLNREVNEIQSLVRDKSATRQVVDRIMFLPLTMTQQLVDLPTWWGAYQRALDGGETEARAVSLADQVVLDSQSGGQVKDLAAIQRGGPLLKLWTTFYGFFSGTYNLTVEATKSTEFKDPMQVVGLVASYLRLWIIPALLGTLLKNLLTGGDWDPEKLAKKAAGDGISYLMGMMVGLRDVAGAVQAATGTSEFNMGYGGPAGARFLGELFKLAQQAHQGEVDAPLLKALNNLGGILLHYPATQINRTVEGAIALKEGRTSNPLALLAGPPPKQ